MGYKAFQLMIDKQYYHNNTPILAGMWGAQNGRLLKNGKGAHLREQIVKSIYRKSGELALGSDYVGKVNCT